MKRHVLCVVLCASCHGEKQKAPAAVASTATPMPVASAPASTSVPEPSAPMDPLAVAKRWNDALNTSDMTALSSLYADRVKYYGVMFDRAALVKKVSEILAKKPYHQDIHDVSHWRVKSGIRVQFHKHFGSRTEAGGYLILDESTHLVIEESDMTTDDTLLFAGKCVPLLEETTVTGYLSHTQGPPPDDYWVIALDKRVCVMGEDGGARSACELPELWGDGARSLRESKTYSLTGSFVPGARHQECAFDVTTARVLDR